MERKTSPIRAALAGVLTFALILLGLPSSFSEAGVVFKRSEPKSQGDGYPESSFGQPPQQPLGRAEGASTYGDRAPAGLVYSQKQDAGARPQGQSAGEKAAGIVSASTGEKAPEGLGGPSAIIPEKAKGVQEVALIAGDLGFFPKTVFVTRDIPVRMFVTGASRDTLCIMMDSFHVRKQVRANEIEEIQFTPTTPGKYRFYCPVNGMEGTMVVRELASRSTE